MLASEPSQELDEFLPSKTKKENFNNYTRISTTHLIECKKTESIAARCLFPVFPFSTPPLHRGLRCGVKLSPAKGSERTVSIWFRLPETRTQLKETQSTGQAALNHSVRLSFKGHTTVSGVCSSPVRAINAVISNHEMPNKNNAVNTRHIPMKSYYSTGNTFSYLRSHLGVKIFGFMQVYGRFLINFGSDMHFGGQYANTLSESRKSP